MPTIAANTSQSFKQFRETFESNGLRKAMGELLVLSDYRFLGIWRFEDGMSAAALHYDLENPGEEHADEVPETATYCTLVRDSRSAFSTANSTEDPRLDQHPARNAVQTYCGFPIMNSEGEVLGTLCHYDVVPRDPEQINVELMLMVASFIALNGHLPSYPRSERR